MKTTRSTFRGRLASIALISFTSATLSLAADQPSRRESYAERYGPLTEHNIFAKDRPITPKAPPPKQANVVQRTPEESLVLRGVALENDGAVRAYIEDVDTSRILKLGIGDSVGRGRIAEITLDAVAYERSGAQVWIETGADLTGRQVVAITHDTTSSPTTGPAEVIDPNDPNLTIEQKMKLRRLHPELQK